MKQNNAKQRERGVGTLIVVLILGGVIVEIALAGILAVTFLNSQNFGVRVSAQALASAQSGFEEAFLRIIRNKNIPVGNNSTDWNHVTSDQLPNLPDSPFVEAIVCKSVVIGNPLTCADALGATGGIYEIVSRATSFTKSRELKAFVAVDPTTGVTTLQSLEEVPYE